MQALLASYEKDDIVLRLGRLLAKHGWTFLGSAGTAKYLNDNGISCRDVAELVGKPILGHRVVTLSRELHAALLSRKEDASELHALGIDPIDLVYVTLYPLEKTTANPSATPEQVLEQTDMGGPALLRSAAKGRRLALSNPSQIEELEHRLTDGTLNDDSYRMSLAAAAERRVADYVETSARYWEKRQP